MKPLPLVALVCSLSTLAASHIAGAQASGSPPPADASSSSPASSPAPETTPLPATQATPPVASEAPRTTPPVHPAPVTAATAPDHVASVTEFQTPLFPIVAGWHNDLFFLSSRDHSFFLAPSGRLQVDGFAFVGPNTDQITADYSSGGTFHRGDVKDGFLIRRARLEAVGGFLDRFTFMLGADFGLSSAPIATDDFIDARIHRLLHFQLGQYDAPFTMENRTSDKYFDFIERSLAVRAFGIPSNKELGLMAWGETENRLIYYSLGIFDGDGQNRLDRDNNLEVMSRVFAHPLITLGGPLANLQIGASLRYGQRGASVDYAYPTMSTAGSWALFNPQIAGGMNPLTVVPDSDQLGIAGEIDVPIDRFDARAEVIYMHNDTREMPALSSDAAHLQGSNATRLGDLSGWGYYIMAGYWVWGTVGVNGRPGYENPPALNLDRPDPPAPPMGLEVLARLDVLDFHYAGGSRGGGAGPADGRYSVYAIEGAVNFWATRHVRFTLDYKHFIFPDQPAMVGMFGAGDNHMHGPHGNASNYGEIGLRLAVAL